ncbi:hypothetical protein HY572_02815 [Candidatus Micrarchaeota archaeon]|nr:hypothetical protein [Candidatus Micrarchaeota archaeon]
MDEWTPALAVLVLLAVVSDVVFGAGGWALIPVLGVLVPVMFLTVDSAEAF